MSRAVVTVTLHLDRLDHNRSLDPEEILQMLEDLLEGQSVFDEGDNEYEVTIAAAEVTVNKQKVVLPQ